jgi:hypothetical protein
LDSWIQSKIRMVTGSARVLILGQNVASDQQPVQAVCLSEPAYLAGQRGDYGCNIKRFLMVCEGLVDGDGGQR